MTVFIVILTVFKWILIVIGLLLALILLLLALVLFPAIRYDLEGHVNDKGFDAGFKIRALFHLLRVYHKPSESKEIIIKILWFRIGRKNKRVKQKNEIDESILETEPLTEEDSPEVKSSSTKKKKENKESVFSRIKRLKNKLSENKELVKPTIKLAAEELKALKPNVFKVKGVVGFDSPDKTGYFIAAVSIVKAVTCLNIEIFGDFEKKNYDVDFTAKGKTSLFRLLLPVIKFVFTKPVWAVIKPKSKKQKKKG